MLRSLSILFACIFLYLPYIGPTTFRYDHFYTMGVFAVFVVALVYDKTVIVKQLLKYFLFYASFMVLTVVLMLMGSGPIFSLVKVVNSFSYPLLVMSLLMFYKNFIYRNYIPILKGLLIASIFINVLSLMQYFKISKDFIIKLMDYYGGEQHEAYKGYGSLAALTAIAAKRSTSLFAHPMAFAMHNLILIALLFGIYKDKLFYKQGISKHFSSASIITFLLINIFGGIFSMSKTYFFSLVILLGFEGWHMFYLSKLKLSAKKIIYILLGVVAVIYPVKVYILDEKSYLGNVIEMIMSGEFERIFSSRFSSKGYLEETGTLDAAFETFNFIFGMGRGIHKYAWADSGYIQALMVGGIFFVTIYYSFIISLIVKLFRSPYLKGIGSSFAILMIVLLIANVGVFVFIFPRVAFLLFMFIFFIIGIYPFFKEKEQLK